MSGKDHRRLCCMKLLDTHSIELGSHTLPSSLAHSTEQLGDWSSDGSVILGHFPFSLTNKKNLNFVDLKKQAKIKQKSRKTAKHH